MPTAWRWAYDARRALALPVVALALAACGGAALSPSGPRPVSFTEIATTQNAAHDGGAAIVVGAAADQTAGAAAPPGRVLVAVYQGQQRTGGHGIRVDRIERDGDRLVVHATLASPPPGSFVTQALTSPAHVVAVAAADLDGLRTAVLLDASGTEQASSEIR